MLPAIDKIDSFLDKETKVQRSLLEVLDHLITGSKLDFEYLGPIGDPVITTKVFDAILAELNNEEISKHTAKTQTLGSIHGNYVVAYLVHNFYVENAQYYLPQTDLGRYDVIKGYNNPTEVYSDLVSLKFNELKDDSILIINSATLAKINAESVFNEQAINALNSKNIFVFFDIDHINLTNLNLSSQTLKALLGKAAALYAQLFARIDNVGLNFDTGKLLCVEGLNLGHLYLKFPDHEQAPAFEKTVSILNRTTLSTPVKLGVDILKALFDEESKHEQVIRLLTEPAFK